MEGGSRYHAKNENKIQTSGHRGSVENIEKLGFKIMKLGMVSCHGKKNWPNRNKFWYKLLANRSFSQEGSWFWEGTCHLCVHNSNLKYKHMFQCTKVG